MMLDPWIESGRLEAGCDEAGRGCLAGPVTAGAVILSPQLAVKLCQEGILNDSKQMSKARRDKLRIRIEAEAMAWAVAHVEPEEIDRINILQASFAAMRRAVRQLSVSPEFLAIDGNRFRSSQDLPDYDCFVKGDARFASIAAASVLAKTHRDERMLQLAVEFPEYKWEKNAGYPTKAHRRAIASIGLSPWHRLTFRQLPR